MRPRVGAAVIDLAGNPREPFFHARDYGLVLAKAFGRKAYGGRAGKRRCWVLEHR